jgi:hypothetical protein
MSDGYCKCGMWKENCRCDEDSGQECKYCGYEGTWGEVADGLCPDEACRDARRLKAAREAKAKKKKAKKRRAS